jgi:hypothetical protein
MADGKLTGGFAVVAWPAKYHDSGIMTFIVGKDGVIYEKDLGEKTPEAAATLTAYNPGEQWSAVLAPEGPNAPRGPRSAKDCSANSVLPAAERSGATLGRGNDNGDANPDVQHRLVFRKWLRPGARRRRLAFLFEPISLVCRSPWDRGSPRA